MACAIEDQGVCEEVAILADWAVMTAWPGADEQEIVILGPAVMGGGPGGIGTHGQGHGSCRRGAVAVLKVGRMIDDDGGVVPIGVEGGGDDAGSDI